MAIRLFGFEIIRQKNEEQVLFPSPVTPVVEDGAINIQSGAHYGIYVDLDGSYRSEIDLLTKYRTVAMQPEMENAIEDIINEAIRHDEKGKIVDLELDGLKVDDSIKKLIRDEFEYALKLLDFNKTGSEIFRRWYIDGRVYYNVVIDPANPREGIQSLTYIDPRRIKKIRNIIKKKNEDGIEVIDKINTFYLYNEKTAENKNQNQVSQVLGQFAGSVKLSEDSVINLTSGLFDPMKSTVLSYMHKAIRPMNNLRFVEDATVIYRVSRAPERRVFYIDVGGMPKPKAEQYLRDMMAKFKNKLVYDSSTGEVRDDRKHASMLEDFWIPRRGEGKNTEITTLAGGQNLGQMEDVLYFEKKLYRALSVPISRLEASSGFNIGRPSEITRDELKFDKFIDKLRNRFSMVFDEILSRQLPLKGICTIEEWNEFKLDVHYRFAKDNNFTELKETEILQSRLNTLTLIQPYLGMFYSKKWVQVNVLQLDEEEIEEMEEEMEEENEQMAEDQMALAAMAPPNQDPNAPGAAGQPQPAAKPVAGQKKPNDQDLNKMVDKTFGNK